MSNKLKVGVIAETKNPPGRRTAVTPKTGKVLLERFSNIELYIQPSNLRCYKDQEYIDSGFVMSNDMHDCDILLGVKEVAIDKLIDNKTYLFFSHVAKKQIYNRKLLQEFIRRQITMIDYEYLTDQKGQRVAAFGYWAGVVGAYNGLLTWGKRTGDFSLKRAYQCFDRLDMNKQLKNITLKPIKILVTGDGRVATGAMETLNVLNIPVVSPHEFLTKQFNYPVICQIAPSNYVQHIEGQAFDLNHFFAEPQHYISTFKPYTKVTDLLITAHYWDPHSPVFFTKEDMQDEDFCIKVVADISCDINKPIPCTIRSSSISNPIYDYNKITGKEAEPFSDSAHINVMAIDHLPGELPRDASQDFGTILIDTVFPYLFGTDSEGIIERATITKEGKLTTLFAYLQDFADGK